MNMTTVTSTCYRSSNFKKIRTIMADLKLELNPNWSKQDHLLKAMIKAIMNNDTEEIKRLLNQGLNVHTPLWRKCPAVALASKYGHVESVRCLIENGADISAPLPIKDLTILHLAVESNNSKMIKFLIDRGINVNIPNDQFDTPLNHAILLNNYEAAQELIKNGAYVDSITHTYDEFHISDVEVTPLIISIHYERLNLFRLLLENAALVNPKTNYNFTPLHLACARGNPEMVKRLLEAGADVNAIDVEQNTPLHMAISNGYIEIIQLLLSISELIIDIPSKNQQTALHLACCNGDSIICRMIIDKGANIDARDQIGLTPLHAAIINQFPDTIMELIFNNASLHLSTYVGRTPLHLLATFTFPAQILELMIAKGAVVNAMDNDGKTPLRIAVENRQHQHMYTLIKNQADVDTKDVKHWTPLHYAASKGDLRSVQILIKYGAKLEPRCVQDWTPMSYAIAYNHIEVIKCLSGHYPLLEDEEVEGRSNCN